MNRIGQRTIMRNESATQTCPVSGAQAISAAANGKAEVKQT
jgi:hypothetical protein